MNGLNDENKKILFFEMLEEERADLAFISESHLLKEDVDKLENTQYQ